MNVRETPEDAERIQLLREYLKLVGCRDRPASVTDAVRYALRLAADAVEPLVREQE